MNWYKESVESENTASRPPADEEDDEEEDVELAAEMLDRERLSSGSAFLNSLQRDKK